MKKDRPEQFPLARTEQLIVKEVDDEVLVYDLKTDQAHCLNKTAALIWRYCDGASSVNDLRRMLQTELNVQIDENVMWLAMDEHKKFDLLDTVPVVPPHLAGLNRRQIIKTIGIAALALPVVFSMATQLASAQGSPCQQPNRPDGCPCTGNAQCTPSHHCVGGFCAP